MTDIIVPSNVSVRDVDEWADALAVRQSLDLRVDQPFDGQLLSESRLVGLVAQARFLRRPLNLLLSERVAPDHFSKSSIATVFGIVADRITHADGTDVTDRVRYHLQAVASLQNGIFGGNRSYLMPVVDGQTALGGYRPFPHLTNVTSETFPTALERLLRSLVTVPSHFPWDFAAQFVFEIWQNTVEHGLNDLMGNLIDGLRCIVVRSALLGPSNVLGDDFSSEYLVALRDRFGDLLHELIEVSVCDSGIGIATRLSGNPNLREEPEQAQVSYLQQAMTVHGSSKKRRGSGLGYPKALRVLDKTRGLLLVNSGGIRAGKTYLPPFEPWPSPLLYSMTIARAGIARGTAVTLLLPVVSER
jgi:hypothetical protein